MDKGCLDQITNSTTQKINIVSLIEALNKILITVAMVVNTAHHQNVLGVQTINILHFRCLREHLMIHQCLHKKVIQGTKQWRTETLQT